ncbi:DUF3019 domain-containing protein [Aliikangiella sp. G2MR2-5]|uniref:DUF3019 domain-containing protein n=1 Tax=Aliikangiella sp. G2MR2-5 TaxID=2788943 RepID=UPI0018A97890
MSPKFCLISAQESYCEVELKIEWRTSAAGDYCLHSNYKEASLHCWHNTNYGNGLIKIKTSASLEFFLIEENSNKRIYSHKVILQKQTNEYRKKRRNPWQFY